MGTVQAVVPYDGINSRMHECSLPVVLDIVQQGTAENPTAHTWYTAAASFLGAWEVGVGMVIFWLRLVLLLQLPNMLLMASDLSKILPGFRYSLHI